MLFLAMPALAFSLLPIIALEAFYLSKALHIKFKLSVKTAVFSNCISTFIGVPLTWFLSVVIQFVTGGGSAFGLESVMGKVLAVTWQAPWLIPYEQDLNWMIPIAGAVLLIPFFFVSWWSELLVSRQVLTDLKHKEVNKAVRNANLITYTLLLLWPVFYWAFNFLG